MLPDFRLAGTPDGLIEWCDQSQTVLEVKSHGTAQNYDSCPSEMHVGQAELNIELFHETTAHRPEDAILIYGGAREASGEEGDEPVLEGVAAVEDAVWMMCLAGDGDAVFVIPEPARASAS